MAFAAVKMSTLTYLAFALIAIVLVHQQVAAAPTASQASPLNRRQTPPSVTAPAGWKQSWTSTKRLSNGASTGMLAMSTIDKTASAVTQAHVNACLSSCTTDTRCGFVNLVKLSKSSLGNVVCMTFPRYIASSSATFTNGPQNSGGTVNYSYGFRSSCTPTNGKKMTCKPQKVNAVAATSTSSTVKATASAISSSSKATTSTSSSTKKSTSTSAASAAASSSAANAASTSSGSSSDLPLPKYALAQSNRGQNFYANQNWDFWTSSDPTHGTVQYVDEFTAIAANLTGINGNNQAYARASSEQLASGQNRPSVRFQSKKAYDAALIVLDVAKMPVGCATWPALWTVAGATWPQNGEIDIVEGVGYTAQGNNRNLMSVHMNGSSTLTSSQKSYTGRLSSSNCETNYGMGNTGCSFYDQNANGPSWGNAFNAAGGGIWAALWGDDLGVRIWFWGRQSGKIPAELSNPQQSSASLNPASWGTPVANYQSSVIDQYLNAQNIVLDITMNGDWAGNVPMDNVAQCGTDRTAALANGSNYVDAEFVLNGIDIYQSSSSSS